MEAAIVTPIFLVLIMGVAEGGLYMKDYLAISSAVRAGARSASAAGNDRVADLYTVLNVARESAGINRNQIDYVVIYKATGYGGSLADASPSCLAGTPQAGVCNVYTPADFAKAEVQVKEERLQAQAVAAGQSRTLDLSKIWFGCQTAGPNAGKSPDRFWCPINRKIANSDNNRRGPDYVGVWIQAKHPWVTRLFGNNKVVSDQSVIQIEPRLEEAP